MEVTFHRSFRWPHNGVTKASAHRSLNQKARAQEHHSGLRTSWNLKQRTVGRYLWGLSPYSLPTLFLSLTFGLAWGTGPSLACVILHTQPCSLLSGRDRREGTSQRMKGRWSPEGLITDPKELTVPPRVATGSGSGPISETLPGARSRVRLRAAESSWQQTGHHHSSS